MVFTMELTLGHHFEQKSQKRLLGYLGDQLTGGRGGKRPQSHIPRKTSLQERFAVVKGT